MSTEAVNTIALDALTSGTLDNSEMLSAGELSSAPEPRAVRPPSTIHSGRTAGGSFSAKAKKRSWDDHQLKAASSDEEQDELNAVVEGAPAKASQESGGLCTKALLACAVLLLGGLGAATFLTTLRQNRTLEDVQDTVNELEAENAELAQALAALAEASALTVTAEPTPTSLTELPAPTGVPTSAVPTPTPTSPLPTTPIPTALPTPSPTKLPSVAPTAFPTPAPTTAPTKLPSVAPTKFPTKAPTPAPTMAPSKAPTKAPTKSPSDAPTRAPTAKPTPAPTGGSCTFVNDANLPYKHQTYTGSWTTYAQDGSTVTVPDGTTVKYIKTNWIYYCDLDKMQTTCQDGTLTPPDCLETSYIGSGMCENSQWGQHQAWFRTVDSPLKTVVQFKNECASDAIKIKARGYAYTNTAGPVKGSCYIFPRFIWSTPADGHSCGSANPDAYCPEKSAYSNMDWQYVTNSGNVKIDDATGQFVTTPVSTSQAIFSCSVFPLYNY